MTQAFASSLDHILAELTRLDLLIRVQVWRVRALLGEADLDDEIDVLLEKAIGTPLWIETPLPPATLAEVQEALDQVGGQIAALRAGAQAVGVDLRLTELARHFDLTEFDLDVILLCLAPEIDLRYSRLYAYLHDDNTRRAASVDLALNLLCPTVGDKLAARARLGATAPLRRHDLVHLAPPPDAAQAPLPAHALQLDPRIAAYLLDDDALDARLLPYATLRTDAPAWRELLLPAADAARLPRLAQRAGQQLFYFQGAQGHGKETVAAALAATVAQPLLVVQGERLLRAPLEDFTRLARLAAREARLQGAALYWAGFDALLADERTAQREAVETLLPSPPGLTFLGGAATWTPADTLAHLAFCSVDLAPPNAAQRRHLWQTQLNGQGEGAEIGPAVDTVAARFRLTPGQIRDAAATAGNLAQARDPDAPRLTAEDLLAAARRHSSQGLTALAQKVEQPYTWVDLVLPEDRLSQLHELCDQARYRSVVHEQWGFGARLALGKGIHALFTGPPGTGKTMAAGIIAHTLGQDLYRIDLATVVSKYIGETEKNLGRIFAEAEHSNAILFFDEADALFGKRTEVKDAHDRYANLEVSYLLQRMEAYEGMVILATNLQRNLDDAFTRRMHFIVDFPFPGAAERLRIWQGIWPAAAPVDPDLDWAHVAERVQLAGGNMRNIALAAAFLAATDGGVVRLSHLQNATQREYAKAGRLVASGEKL